jgi:hypothetical protein
MEISLRVPSPQDDFDGLKHDQRVEADGGMLDIEKIVIFRAPPEACCRTCNAPVAHSVPTPASCRSAHMAVWCRVESVAFIS